MTDLLEGQTAVITGGGGAIGAAVGRLLHARGARVALLDLHGEAAASKAQELAGGGPNAMGVQADVRRRADVARALDTVVERFGRSTSWSTTQPWS